jgi:hypothetical protein
MSVMNVLALGDVADAMAAEKQREMTNWAMRQHLAANAGPRDSGFSVVRAGVGDLLIRVGGWVGGAKVAPRLSRQMAH